MSTGLTSCKQISQVVFNRSCRTVPCKTTTTFQQLVTAALIPHQLRFPNCLVLANLHLLSPEVQGQIVEGLRNGRVRVDRVTESGAATGESDLVSLLPELLIVGVVPILETPTSYAKGNTLWGLTQYLVRAQSRPCFREAN